MDWDQKLKLQQEHQKEMFEKKRRAQSQDRSRDRELAMLREEARQTHQVELTERRHELKLLEQRLGVEGESLLELVRHQLEPEHLERLTDDYARRKSIDLQAFEQESGAVSQTKVREIEALGDDERRTIKANLKAKLTEKLVEHQLKAKEMKLSHELEKEMASHQAQLSGELSTETMDELEDMVRRKVQAKK
ncbi:MAG: hypothetical protein AAF558_00115 [Verrucomicrobiota bacterium]